MVSKACSAIAAIWLASVLAEAPAKAAVFDFSFGPDAFGTFTTGAAAADPGYDLITGLTFDVLSVVTDAGETRSVTDAIGDGFAPSAAFNPTTQAFINHSVGSTFDDIGAFGIPTDGFIILGLSFSFRSLALQGDLVDGDDFLVASPLVITPAPIPELPTWVMMIAGFAGLGYFGLRKVRTQASVPS